MNWRYRNRSPILTSKQPLRDPHTTSDTKDVLCSISKVLIKVKTLLVSHLHTRRSFSIKVNLVINIEIELFLLLVHPGYPDVPNSGYNDTAPKSTSRKKMVHILSYI